MPLDSHVQLSERAPAGLLAGVWLVNDAAALLKVTSGIAVTRDGLGYDADRGVAFRSGASGEAALLRARRELEGAHTAAEACLGREHPARGRGSGRRRDLAAVEQSEAAHAAALAAARSELAAAERAEREAVAAREAPLGQPSEPSTIVKRPSGSASS